MKSFNLFLKVLVEPVIDIDTLIKNMERVYGAAGFRFELSVEDLNLPDYNTVRVGDCDNGPLTAMQEELFEKRNGASPTDIVVYFVHSTSPVFSGCALHPPDRPGAVVVRDASRWTLAHEVGHVLGLDHVDEPDRLMTRFTGNLPDPPAPLSPDEIETIARSDFVF
ncbi:MAG TPA: matrixin family metalloprotease [Verrucomicrobiales bacterium]|jgi:hypothetical protein|nr:matrixin family metalloprotease [Verrucomicrobiales bacterium]